MPIGGLFPAVLMSREEKGNVQWCHDNYINSRSMKTAVEIRKQLVGYCQKIGIDEIVVFFSLRQLELRRGAGPGPSLLGGWNVRAGCESREGGREKQPL